LMKTIEAGQRPPADHLQQQKQEERMITSNEK